MRKVLMMVTLGMNVRVNTNEILGDAMHSLWGWRYCKMWLYSTVKHADSLIRRGTFACLCAVATIAPHNHWH